MLRLLEVRDGDRVLDVGAGSGWTTALLAHLTGPTGSGDGLELEPDLVKFGRPTWPGSTGPGRGSTQAGPGVLGRPGRGAVRPDPGVREATRPFPPTLVEQLGRRRPDGAAGRAADAPGRRTRRVGARSARTARTGSCRCAEPPQACDPDRHVVRRPRPAARSWSGSRRPTTSATSPAPVPRTRHGRPAAYAAACSTAPTSSSSPHTDAESLVRLGIAADPRPAHRPGDRRAPRRRRAGRDVAPPRGHRASRWRRSATSTTARRGATRDASGLPAASCERPRRARRVRRRCSPARRRGRPAALPLHRRQGPHRVGGRAAAGPRRRRPTRRSSTTTCSPTRSRRRPARSTSA